MKFEFYCRLEKDERGRVTAYNSDMTIHNVLVSSEKNCFYDSLDWHTFILVVNKKGQLTLLCID